MRNLENKTVLITGATSGIGRAVAELLAGGGAHLVIMARDRERGAKTVEELRNTTKNGKIDLIHADLSLARSVREAAAEFLRRNQRLDILINNATQIFQERTVTAEGIEASLATNHLSYFLLTDLLLGRLKASAPSRIVNVVSGAHPMGKLDLEDLNAERRRYKGFEVYATTKLMNVLFTYELSRRMAGTGVTVNCLHPGMAKTNYARDMKGLFRFMWWTLLRPIMGTPRESAENVVHLATAPEFEQGSGLYLLKRKPGRSAPATYDVELARKVWDASERLLRSVMTERRPAIGA